VKSGQQSAVFAEIPDLIFMEVFKKILPGHAVQAVAAVMQETGLRLKLNPAPAFVHSHTEVYVFEPRRVESFVEAPDR
jgi:hypothetical protein